MASVDELDGVVHDAVEDVFGGLFPLAAVGEFVDQERHVEIIGKLKIKGPGVRPVGGHDGVVRGL